MINTIIAISTAPNNGAIGIVRISGENSFNILERYFKSFSKNPIKSRYAVLGQLYNKEEKLDKCLAFYFKGPYSYSGEDMVEFHLHGSYFLLNKFTKIVIDSKMARLAEPGEFTRRAFENGRISLNDAEAINRLIKSETEMQIKIANNATDGKLVKTVNQLRSDLLALIAEIEALIEYPEEVTDEDCYIRFKKIINMQIEVINKLLKGFFSVQKIFSGIKIVIAGQPNVGKSSLLNAIAGFERVIVTDIPGTTTDSIEVILDINGFKVVFVDTAGLRKSKNLIELMGIERAEREILDCDIVLHLKENFLKNNDLDKVNIRKETKYVEIQSKSDLIDIEDREEGRVYVSAITGEGIDELKNIITKHYSNIDLSSGVVITKRQNSSLENALVRLENVRLLLNEKYFLDIISSELNESIWSLEALIGKVTSDDVLDKMFCDFCLGK